VDGASWVSGMIFYRCPCDRSVRVTVVSGVTEDTQCPSNNAIIPRMTPDFTRTWTKDACERIESCQSTREAINTAAGFISDLLDEQIRLRGKEAVDYLQFVQEEIHRVKALSDRTEREWHLDYLVPLDEVLRFYERMSEMEEWEIDFTAKNELAPLLTPLLDDPELDRDEEVIVLLMMLVFYLRDQVEGIVEAWREWELQSLKEWPDTTPYDDPPDGMDEFAQTGWE